MTGSRSKSGIGKIRHLGSMSEESGSRYKAQLLALSEGHVLVRKARKFELPISIRLNDRRGVKLTPLPQAR